MGALKRPSNGPLVRANGLSSRRNEVSQRALPKAARQDQYALPESPEKIRGPKLRPPAAGLPKFSPLRKQRAPAATATASGAKDDLTVEQVPPEIHDVSPPDCRSDMTSPRRSLRTQAMANMPAEEFVGSVKRHASPVVELSRAEESDMTSNGLFDKPGHVDAVDASMEDPANPCKRVRLPSKDGRNVPSKRDRRSVLGADESGRVNVTRDKPGQDASSSYGQPAQSTPESENGHRSRTSTEDQSTTYVKPTRIRPSEIDPSRGPQASINNDDYGQSSTHDAADKEEEGVDGEEGGRREANAVLVAAIRKRILKAKKTKASKSKLESTNALPKTYVAADELSESSDSDHEDDAHSLGPQYITLKNVCTNSLPIIENIGDGEDLDGTIEEMRSFCRSLRKKLSQLRNNFHDTELESELSTDLRAIQSRVDLLRGENADRTNRMQSRSIYFCLFPALMRVLWSLVRCYQALDAREDNDGMFINITHMREIQRFTGIILRLGDTAKRYVKPDMDIGVVAPVTSGILVPLKKVARSLHREVVGYEERRQQQMQAQRERHREAVELAEAQARAEAAEELAEAQEQAREAAESAKVQAYAETLKWQRLEKKWDDLHVERKRCEGSGIMPQAKRRHLLQPRARLVELDHIGDTFTRIEVFRPRIGPQHATVERIKSQVWPERSQQALVDGLIKWAGDILVFERIFRAYCWRGEPLNPYNVTEIVVQAAQLKKALEKECDVESEEWAWVADIPDWTKADTLLQQLQASELD